MTKQTTPSVASARPRRSPLAAKSVLSVRNKEDGYFYRIVNTNLEKDPERVERLIERGYEIVPKDKSGPIGDKRVDAPSAPGSASTLSVGQGTKAVLMRIPMEYKLEDDAIKQQAVDDMEQSMRRPANADYGKLTIE